MNFHYKNKYMSKFPPKKQTSVKEEKKFCHRKNSDSDQTFCQRKKLLSQQVDRNLT